MSDRGQAFHLVEAAGGLRRMGMLLINGGGMPGDSERHGVSDNEDLIKEMEHSTRPGRATEQGRGEGLKRKTRSERNRKGAGDEGEKGVVLHSAKFTDSQNGTIMAALGHPAPRGMDVMGCSSASPSRNMAARKLNSASSPPCQSQRFSIKGQIIVFCLPPSQLTAEVTAPACCGDIEKYLD
ncbi:unnamed protein product [Pleuronectes platessa]|uniref:Uncharacterized protein n=1 Tax=Pleuronectes platessa TaxID=8262 RepID=A0A9N7V6C2_PLEPL|nr:unnamed protein product [Pleuronectes platessa]